MFGNILPIHLEIEASANSSPTYREQVKKDGGMFLSEFKNASADKLYQLLGEKNIIASLNDIREASTKYVSALELFNVLKSEEIEYSTWDENICQLALIFLWQKENGGNHPCLEFFDYHIYNGYACLDSEDVNTVLKEWYEAYKLMFYFIHRTKISSLDLLKEQLEGNYELKPWLEDYLTLLMNVSEPFYLQQQRVICEQFLDIFDQEKSEVIFLIKISYAGLFFAVGQEKRGDQLYEQWLVENPTWTHGWIAWADYYWTSTNGRKNEKERFKKAIEILEKSLRRIPTSEKKDIWIRLKTLYEREGLTKKALNVATELKQILDQEKEQERAEKSAEEQFLNSLMDKTKIDNF